MRWDDTIFVKAKVASGSPPNEMEGKKEELRQRLREALSNAGAAGRRKVGILVVREHDVLYTNCFMMFHVLSNRIEIYLYLFISNVFIYIYIPFRYIFTFTFSTKLDIDLFRLTYRDIRTCI